MAARARQNLAWCIRPDLRSNVASRAVKYSIHSLGLSGKSRSSSSEFSSCSTLQDTTRSFALAQTKSWAPYRTAARPLLQPGRSTECQPHLNSHTFDLPATRSTLRPRLRSTATGRRHFSDQGRMDLPIKSADLASIGLAPDARSSALSSQPSMSNASETGRTPCQTPARTQLQRNTSSERPNAYRRQYRSTRLKRPHTTARTSASHMHAPLFAVASPTTGSTSLSRPIALATTCGDTAAEKQPGRASTARQAGVSKWKGWCRETPGGIRVAQTCRTVPGYFEDSRSTGDGSIRRSSPDGGRVTPGAFRQSAKSRNARW